MNQPMCETCGDAMQWRRVSFADTATWGTYDDWVCIACHRIEERMVIALCVCVVSFVFVALPIGFWVMR